MHELLFLIGVSKTVKKVIPSKRKVKKRFLDVGLVTRDIVNHFYKLGCFIFNKIKPIPVNDTVIDAKVINISNYLKK